MNAEFFTAAPRAAHPARDARRPRMDTRMRRLHRWVSMAFTLAVAANFTVMIWGQPPAWVTYSPLPPLLILLVTGLVMLGRHQLRSWRNRQAHSGHTVGAP